MSDQLANLIAIPILAVLVGTLYGMRHQIGAMFEAKAKEITERLGKDQAWSEGYALGVEDGREFERIKQGRQP